MLEFVLRKQQWDFIKTKEELRIEDTEGIISCC